MKINPFFLSCLPVVCQALFKCIFVTITFYRLISSSIYLGRDDRDGRNGKKNEQQTSSLNVQILRGIKGCVANCFKIPSRVRE